MSSYFIKELKTEGYDSFLLWLSSESLIDNIHSIEQSPNISNASGKMLIDQLLLTGNGDNRFISCDYHNGKLDLRSVSVAFPTDFFRKETMKWLHDHYDYLSCSILTETLQQKIRDGVDI
ncbi:MAG: type II toxin-antitoxin system RnlB family antitoxin [Oscillospiraceae bacterium]|nr:type II toxin-antitoxin system RnlB family antitoxin [Oscillospiraceae bacterium]